jgi:hypothetical protein
MQVNIAAKRCIIKSRAKQAHDNIGAENLSGVHFDLADVIRREAHRLWAIRA